MVNLADIRDSEEVTPCLHKQKMQKMEVEMSNHRDYLLDLLMMLFGTGAWIGVNGMYVQLPLIVPTAPESWSLPSYLAVVVQIANIGPLTYSLLRKLFPNIKEKSYILGVLSIGTVAMALMAFFYQITTYIGGEERSTILLLLVFFVSLVGCTSSVLFYPFMRHYREMYLISYLIGEGLSGFLPSILALIQGVGGNPECKVITYENGTIENIEVYPNPLFSSRYFLLTVAIIMLFSFLSFVLINVLRRFDSQKVIDPIENVMHQTQRGENKHESLLTFRNINLFILMGFVCALGNGVFPSIQSFSCLPYGNLAYHLAVTLGSMANPLACFLAMFLPRTSNKALIILASLCCLFAGYNLTTAILSPSPPLVGQTIGEILVIVSWVFSVGLVSYVKLCVATVFRTLGGKAMFYCGAVSQLGSALASLLFFFLINYGHVFQRNDPCR